MRKTIVIVLISILVSSCKSNATEKSVLDESSCRLPCWSEITPGKTTKDEYVHIIQQVTIDGKEQSVHVIEGETLTIFDGVISSEIESGWLFNKKLDVWIQAWWAHDNVIRYMEICGDNNILNITIGDLVEQIGEPEFIVSGINHLGGKDVGLVKPEKGLSFWYRTDDLPSSQQENIDSNIKIRCLDLFDVAMYKDLMNIGLFSNGFYNAEETQKVMYLWDGYGNLDEKYPPRQP